jgi:hypothetical protein
MGKPLNFQRLQKGDTFARLGELLKGDTANNWEPEERTFAYSAVVPMTNGSELLVSVGFLNDGEVADETVCLNISENGEALFSACFHIRVFTVAYVQDIAWIARLTASNTDWKE